MGVRINQTNHKTIFLLDLTSNFFNKSSEQAIEFDVFTKNRPAGIVPLASICKSLWTCTVEAILEYARIIWDLFPENDKLLSFVAFKNNGSSIISSWNDEYQNMNYLSSGLSKVAISVKPPKQSSKAENFWLTGITDCIELLGTFTPLQWELNLKKKEIINKGRLIVITNFQNNNQVNQFIKHFSNSLNTFNKNISNQTEINENSKILIQECHLVILNTYPINQEVVKITEFDFTNFSSILSYEVHNIKSGTFIALKMITMLLNHYNLSSTTVTGIPMKEEQNASSSANYDVEIVHLNEAHQDLLNNSNNVGETSNLKTAKEDVDYETVSLKWCTPKGSMVELHQCTGAYRITAVDVNSRPSSCLINFLLSGRTVMLEMPKLKGKCMSHMLSSHCGELYIHTLGYGRSIIEDPPSISEGTGGRATDYRINDFCELIKQNHLVKCKPISASDFPLEKAKQHLTKQTLYWAMTIGHTIIFNLNNQIKPLLNYIPKETLTLDEVNECHDAIYQLVAMERKNTSFFVPSVLPKSKSIKKGEIYKLMWKELEYFVEKHAITPEHNKVLTCLKELQIKFDNSKENLIIQNQSSNKKYISLDDGEIAWKELDCYNSLSEREKSDLNNEPPSHKKVKLENNFYKSNEKLSNKLIKKTILNEPLSLYGLYLKKLDNENQRKGFEFKGRQNGSSLAVLYPNLNELNSENPL